MSTGAGGRGGTSLQNSCVDEVSSRCYKFTMFQSHRYGLYYVVDYHKEEGGRMGGGGGATQDRPAYAAVSTG